MEEIVGRLTENRQVELAKSILESNGYRVTKKNKSLKESTLQELFSNAMTGREVLDVFEENGDEDYIDMMNQICDLLGCSIDEIVTIDDSEGSTESNKACIEVIEKFPKTVKKISLAPGESLTLRYDPSTGKKCVAQWSWGMNAIYIKRSNLSESNK